MDKNSELRLKGELERIKELIDRELINLKKTVEGPEELKESSFHLIMSGGKRIRPFILIKAAEIYGVEIKEALPAALAVELLHNFTLIHDDIIDKDEYRRGVKTTHVLYGEPLAIVAGDFLFSLLFHILSTSYPPHISSKLVEILSETCKYICYGQTMDLLSQKHLKSIDDYLRMAYLKTGALFEASAKCGGVIGGGKEDEINGLAEYGGKIGLAFQIVDDILGIYGDPKVTGKPIGSDILNGKTTIVILKALPKIDEYERRTFDKVFGNRSATEEEVYQALEIVRKRCDLSDIISMLNTLYKEAIAALSVLPDCEAKKDLITVAEFIIKRSY
ncbi:MAG: polyprenyl synthetase family protein [Candidatus Geothermarchaeota archaeon]